jgi:ketosteroid isomerase-like protein
MRAVVDRVEAVRRVVETAQDFIRGAREPFEEALEELTTEDLLVVPSSALASGDSGPFRGRDSLVHQQEEVARQWPEFELIVDEYLDVPPNTVVTLGKVAARRGDGSGYAVEVGVVSRFEDGRIASMHSYESKRRALEDAGVELAARRGSDDQA